MMILSPTSWCRSWSAVSALLLVAVAPKWASAECLSNPEFNSFFANLSGVESIPTPDSCCMFEVCGLECPTEVSDPTNGYGIAIIVSILISFFVGIAALISVRGRAVNFFVAGRSLPLWMIAVMLCAQCVDSNALLGNVDLAYKYSFWDGAVIPIGLGLSLILNGLFLAHHINSDCVLTLPDVFAKCYGRVVEVCVSLATVCSFLMLLAGNLVGCGVTAGYAWGLNETAAIWTSAAIVWGYTVTGGLFSIAYTDIVQGLMGWPGCLVMAFYFIANGNPMAPPPSIGFPGYMYPDNQGDGGICDMYNGTACVIYPDRCCYNEALWCPDGNGACIRYDRGAYPTGDQPVYAHQMTDSEALSPFPNAIMWNWATIIILGIGNLAALDFQSRCMASKTPTVARLGCLIGGLFTFLIGIPFSYLGAFTRVYYGPDATNSVFEADTCAVQLGLPTCAEWVPDESAFVKLLTHQAPPVLGAWCMVGIIAASMSTAAGAILAMGTVMSHNVARQLDVWYPDLVTPENLLRVARLTTIPFTITSTMIAAFYRESDSAAGATGYLLIVAFDIVFATVVVPLFGCYYTNNPSPRAALLSILCGATARIVLEFAIPKDGQLLLPFDSDLFLNYGPAASTLYPAFIDVPSTDYWDPTTEPCEQERYEDYTGVDSISSFLVSLIVFVSVQALENWLGRALFEFGGSTGYLKDSTEHPMAESKKMPPSDNVDDDAVVERDSSEEGLQKEVTE